MCLYYIKNVVKCYMVEGVGIMVRVRALESSGLAAFCLTRRLCVDVNCYHNIKQYTSLICMTTFLEGSNKGASCSFIETNLSTSSCCSKCCSLEISCP